MKSNEFKPDAPGRVVKSPLGHWTFLPDPLPPTLAYTPELVKVISEADLALGELKGAGFLLPNPHLLIQPFIRKEAVLSSKIEGTVTQLDDLFLFEADPERGGAPADAREVRNYVRAMEYGLSAIRDGQPFSLKLLRELHKLLLEGVRGEEKRPGQLRDRAVLIGSSFDFEAARFVPPCHTQLDGPLQDFVTFLRDERTVPVIVQLALMHYQFETIHPFNDGNGRVGRLLITLMLGERGVLREPLLYLSAFFESHRQQYYDHLLDVSRKGAWNEWIGFVALGVTEQAKDAILRVRRLLDLREEFRTATMRETRSNAALRLIDNLFSSPYITIGEAQQVMEVAFKSAANVVATLERISILREITGDRRNRVFRADRIFRLLDEPLLPEP